MLILLPVDGTPLALDAVRHALLLVQNGLRADFVLANVQEPTHLYEIVLAPHAEMLEAASDAAGRHALDPAEALLRQAGVRYECEVAAGDVAHTLIDIAERYGCDAIIMGSGGKNAFSSALLGSVSQTVLHDAQVPVTIVKHPELIGDSAETPSDAAATDA